MSRMDGFHLLLKHCAAASDDTGTSLTSIAFKSARAYPAGSLPCDHKPNAITMPPTLKCKVPDGQGIRMTIAQHATGIPQPVICRK